MNQDFLSFENVFFGYEKKSPPVINGLNLQINEGKIASILGPNGAGKTTLLFLALGWLRNWKGNISLLGKPLQNYSRKSLGKLIALIPQSEHIPFEYTVLEYVLLGRAPYLPPLGMPSDADQEIAFEALERVGISHLYSSSILGISGGERQLVLAARALTQKPRLLLLDEPTSHLDLSNKYRLIKILRKLKEEGTTILMTTHEPEIALAISDDTILMNKGQVVSTGSTADVVSDINLTQIYSVPVKIIEVEGKRQVQWI
jgi:iron complex transport system ATP-binding protein